ncbi:hypothetical protein JHK86_042903 [Glycine max]|nr:hypothetical protein JHK86_042903 [Glycine max]
MEHFEKKILEKMHECTLKSTLHIESRVKQLKKHYNAICEMKGPRGGSGFGWNDKDKMIVRLCRRSMQPEEDILDLDFVCSDPTRVVPSHKDSNDHKHEDEKSGDWQEIGKNLKLNEECNHNRGYHHSDRDIHYRPDVLIN